MDLYTKDLDKWAEEVTSKINWLGYSTEHIGMIHWCNYWDKYSLIIDVNEENISELDSFGSINKTNEHKIRTHSTRLDKKDKFYTVEEFFLYHYNTKIQREINNDYTN